MQKRLTDLIEASGMVEGRGRCEIIAEELLCEGVIVPPCKMGDMVYCLEAKRPCYACFACSDWCHKDCKLNDRQDIVVKEAVLSEIIVRKYFYGMKVNFEQTEGVLSYEKTYSFADIGKTVFLIREEAEKHLRKGAKNGRLY